MFELLSPSRSGQDAGQGVKIVLVSSFETHKKPLLVPVSVQMEDQEESDGQVAVVDEVESSFPPKYAVILHNDDYTPMDFVIEVLQRFFKKSREEATQIMLKVHHEGKGVAGTFTFEIAETKAAQVSHYAQGRGHPLKCTAEPLGD